MGGDTRVLVPFPPAKALVSGRAFTSGESGELTGILPAPSEGEGQGLIGDEERGHLTTRVEGEDLTGEGESEGNLLTLRILRTTLFCDSLLFRVFFVVCPFPMNPSGVGGALAIASLTDVFNLVCAT